MEKRTRKEQKENTRSALIRQAENLFARKGIANTTTADIATALNLSHGTLFVHFPKRDDLIKSVVEEFGERLAAALGERCTTDLDLSTLLRAHLNVLCDFEDFYIRLILESHSLPGHIRTTVYAINASLSYRFYRAAKIEMEKGRVKQLSQIYFFNTWMALVHYSITNRDLFSEKTPILKEVGNDIVKHFLHLIKQ